MSAFPCAAPPGDAHSGEAGDFPPSRLDPDTLRTLSRLNPYVSSLHIALEWTVLLGAGALCWRFFHPCLYGLTVAFIGARQHSIATLMHEAAHYRLFSNRRLNDWVGELALAWPFFVLSMRSYRENHFQHHRHLNTARDPDWVSKRDDDWRFPMSARKLAALLLLDLIGVGFVKLVRKARSLPRARSDAPDQRAMRIVRPLYSAGLLGLLAWLGWLPQFALFWLVPFLTWFQFCMHVRSIAEHFAIPTRSGFYGGTRSTTRGLLDRLFVMSNDTSFHAEHHLYPSVPFYRLNALHLILMDRGDHRRSLQLSSGYWRVLRECAGAQRS